MKNIRIFRPSVLIKLVFAAVVMTVLCGLTGCSASVTALSEDENREIAQYMADKLLRYDTGYMGTELVYIDPTQVTEAPEASGEPISDNTAAVTEEPTAMPSDVNGESAGQDNKDIGTEIINWDDFFTNDEWTVKYSAFDTYHTYPKASDVYAIDASKGKQLLVLSFLVVNRTDGNIVVDLTDEKLSYVLYVGGERYSPMVAILENGGLLYLNVKLAPGESEKAELVFEIPDGINLSDMRLEVSR